MSRSLPTAIEAANRLRKVELLLEEALEDLTAGRQEAPASRCAAALAGAATELRAFQFTEKEAAECASSDCSSLRQRVNALQSRLRTIESCLLAAEEFYRGWCAAAPPATYPVPTYEAAGWSNARGPALLAIEG